MTEDRNLWMALFVLMLMVIFWAFYQSVGRSQPLQPGGLVLVKYDSHQLVTLDNRRDILRNALKTRLAVHHSGKNGKTVMVGHCRSAKEGCDKRLAQYAEWFVAASDKHGVDAWTLAAMGVKESSLNPAAVGARGEFGIMQLHPGSIWGRKASRVCKKIKGDCTPLIVDIAAEAVRSYVRLCGSIGRALGAYNGRRCAENGYSERVSRERQYLVGLGFGSAL